MLLLTDFYVHLTIARLWSIYVNLPWAQKVMIIQSSLCDYARVFSLLFFRRIMHENLIMLILRGRG